MRYDREDDVLMIWFDQKGQVDHAEQVGQTILHLTEQGAPVLMEILNAQDFVMDIVRSAIAPIEATTT
jgi:uncharacterized protein YuzE